MALRWDPRVAMSAREIDNYLAGRLVARISTVSPDGYPNVTPAWYYWDSHAIFLDLGRRRSTTRNLRKNPKCAVIVDTDERPLIGVAENRAKAVLMVGDAELYEASPGHDAPELQVGGRKLGYPDVIELIGRRYVLDLKESTMVERLISGAASDPDHILSGESERVIVKIKPKKVTAWDFSKAPFSG
jgi:hypothetical protein